MALRLRLLLNPLLFITFLASSGYSKPERAMGGIYNELPAGLDEVDVIIAGGGTAGCVLASRLSDQDPDLSILVIERGKNNVDNPAVEHPLFWLTNVLPGSDRMLLYNGASESQLGGRGVDILTGSILGGGSSINVMVYSRAQGAAMDDWGITGWAAKDMLPYMQKFETYHGNVDGSPDTHGYDGPIHVTPSGDFGPTRLQDQFIHAAARVGYPEAVDLQDLDTINAFQRCHRYIDPDGKRQDAAHAYLHPRLQDGKHPNLHVLTEHHVLRVLIEGGKAVGVEFIRNPELSDGGGTATRVRARRMVVVTAGNFGSPLILQRSGVGDPEVLAEAGIDTAVDLPGVGRNLQDHLGFFTAYLTTLPANETYNGILAGSESLDDLVAQNNPKVGWNAHEITSRLRPSKEEVRGMGSEFEAAWNQDFKDSPTKAAGVVATYGGYFSGILPGTGGLQLFSVAGFVSHPYSRGSIHATGPSYTDTPRLVSGFLSDANGVDTQLMVWLYKRQREIIRRMPSFRGEYAPDHPSFPKGSKAACVTVDEPLPEDVADIEYTPADDKAIEEWARGIVASHSHSSGTCRMGSRGDGAVLDARLNVYGVEGLKVADLSIAPSTSTANSANLAFTIGEKAADMITEELGRRTS